LKYFFADDCSSGVVHGFFTTKDTVGCNKYLIEIQFDNGIIERNIYLLG
jgi:hypothetical protein